MMSFWWRHQITSSKWCHKIFPFSSLFSKVLVAPLIWLCVKSKVLQFSEAFTTFPPLVIDPIDQPLQNNAAKRSFLLIIILFSTIVNDINCCAITFPQIIHDNSHPSPVVEA